MSKKFTFTHASLRKFFEANGKAICWDATTRGLGAYARNDGGITLFCMWRVGSRLKKKALFHLGERSLQEARTMCAEYTISGRHGKDVLAEQKQASHQALTLFTAYEAHRQSLIRRGASERSIALNASNWKLRLEKHGSRTLSSITKFEARNWHEGWLRAGAGPTANEDRRLCWRLSRRFLCHELGSRRLRNLDAVANCRKGFSKPRRLRADAASMSDAQLPPTCHVRVAIRSAGSNVNSRIRGKIEPCRLSARLKRPRPGSA